MTRSANPWDCSIGALKDFADDCAEIPVGSAIVSCCDAFDAMTTDRSYREAMPLEDAIEELEANSGTQFSPDVVTAVLRVLREDPLTAGLRGPRAVAAAA